MADSTPQDCGSMKEKLIKEEHVESDTNHTKSKHDIPKQDTKDAERDTPKQDTKDAERDTPKQDTKDAERDTPKQDTKDAERDTPKQDTKDAERDTPKQDTKDAERDTPKQDMKDVEHPTKANEKNKVDTSTAPDTAETEGLRRVRHPQLGDQSEFYINKKGDLYRRHARGMRPLPRPKPRKRAFPRYMFTVNGKYIGIGMDELMVETFLGPMGGENQYIIHKDGDKDNYELDNLTVGDLDALRKAQIEHFKKVEPDVQYVKVKDLDDTLTFDDYIVSSTGKVFSLPNLQLYKGFTRSDGYGHYGLVSDPQGHDRVRVRKLFLLHKIVYHSFHGRLKNANWVIYHVDGDRSNNSVNNISCGTRKEVSHNAFRPVNKAARSKNKEQGQYNQMYGPLSKCLPLTTEETKWKTIGVLPWNGLSFSGYQVSDAGHVRRISGRDPQIYQQRGFLRVSIAPDSSSDESNTERRIPHLVLVSRLVAHAFVDGYSETKCHVLHRNKNILDNRAENLEWVERYSARSRRVVVTLVNDPSAVKEYRNMTKAKQDLGTSRIYPIEGGGTYIRPVLWDGVMQDAKVQVL